MGFQFPTQIQAQAIPVVVSGKDVYPLLFPIIDKKFEFLVYK